MRPSNRTRARAARPRAPVPVARPSARPAAGRRAGPTRPLRQGGVALVVALVLLVATSVLAVATLTGTRLGEGMASNAQRKAVAFEAAESGIGSVLADAVAVKAALATAPGNDPDAVVMDGFQDALRADYDQDLGGSYTLDLEGDLTVQHCGEAPNPPGYDMNANKADTTAFVSRLFDVRAVVTGNAAQADHVQRMSMPVIAGGTTGACPAP